MESNTINFLNLPSTINSELPQPQMMDEVSQVKGKSPSNDSTNFLQFQNYQKHSSYSSKQTLDSNQDSNVKSSFPSLKTKHIHKPNKLLKEQDKINKNQPHSICYNILSRTHLNQNLIKNAQKNHKEAIKKPIVKKSHSLVSVFDWMMEIASIMKLTRSTFYRACNVFYEVYKKDQTVIQNLNVQKYACACLLISAKLQKSNMDYLGQLYFINKKRISKQLITKIEIQIYKKLEWKLPLLNPVNELVVEVLSKWNGYLEKRYQSGRIKQETLEKCIFSLEYSPSQTVKNKAYGEMLYLLDIMVFNQAKKYMNGVSLSDIEQGKSKKLFATPIVIAMYSVLTIQLGDTENMLQYLLPLVKQFCKQRLQMNLLEIDRLSKQIQISFMLFHFSQCISKLPLNKDWSENIENGTQTYLPIKLNKKTQII